MQRRQQLCKTSVHHWQFTEETVLNVSEMKTHEDI